LKTTDPLSLRPSLFGKRLKENVNPASPFGNLVALKGSVFGL
jgi:hypothetical protein